MSRTIKLAITSVAFIFIVSCGGGSGGGTANGGSTSLTTSIQNVSSSTMTVGNSNSANGSIQIVLLNSFRNLLKSFGNSLIKSAFAQSVSSCQNANNSQLIGSQDSKSWTVMGLTTSTSSPSCVTGFQDAGNYLVLAVNGVTNGSNNICDLVVITKSNGNTTCINLPLPNRNLTGNPSFVLSAAGYLTGATGQLSANGNYFLTGFYTNNSSSAYIGYELLDFTGPSPSGKLVYAEYGTQVSNCDGTPSVNGHNIFWSSFWLQENANFVFNQFNVTQCSVTPATGISKFYYVDSNNTTDPLNPVKYLFNVNAVTSTDGYGIDTTSPLATWLNTNIPSGSNWHFGSEILPGGSTSTLDLSFYIVTGGGVNNNCTTGTGTSVYGVGTGINGQELLKVVINNGNVTFQDYGATNIGTGFGANPLTDNAYLTSDGQNLVSVHWTDDNGSMKVMQITRALNATACDSYSKISPPSSVNTPVSLSGQISTVDNGNFVARSFPFTYRSKDYIYLYGFNSNPGDPSCTSTNGCKVNSDTQIWAFNKSSNSISIVSINQLIGLTTFYSTETISNPLSNKVTNTLLDSSGNKYWVSINPTGITKMIKFPSSFDISKGFISGSN